MVDQVPGLLSACERGSALLLLDHALGAAGVERAIEHGRRGGHEVVVLARRGYDATRPHALGAVECVEVDPASPGAAAARLERWLELRRLAVEAADWRSRSDHLFASSPTPAFEADEEGGLRAVNAELVRAYGVRGRELVGRQVQELFPELDWADTVLSVRGDGAALRREARLCRGDGALLEGWLALQVVEHDAGSTVLGWFVDGSREVALAEAVRRREALYVELFSAMAEPTVILDAGGIVRACNASGERILGLRAAELVGRPFRAAVDRFLEADGRPFAESEEDPLRDLLDVGGDRYLGIVRRDGSVAWVTARARAVPVPGETTPRSQILLSLLDDTEKRVLRARAQRAELDTRVALGAAHDARNLLTVIRAAADLIHGGTEPPQETAHLAVQIEQAAARASDLVGRFAALARAREPRREVFRVDSVLLGLRDLLETVVKGAAQLRLDLDASTAVLVGEPLELERSVLNLVLNAKDALEARGTIRIATRCEDDPNGDDPAHGRWLMVAVEDDGCGMSHEVRERATQAYYTTREATGGTGLGLDNVARFARSQGGRIEIASAAPQGTSVRLWLPLGAAAGRDDV